MIATATLSGSSLPAEVSFSRSGRRKMAGGVLDGGRCCSTRRQLARKSWLAFGVHMSGARSEALFDPLRVK